MDAEFELPRALTADNLSAAINQIQTGGSDFVETQPLALIQVVTTQVSRIAVIWVGFGPARLIIGRKIGACVLYSGGRAQ
ncbi:hypothetical protein [Nocardia africana]